MEIRKPESRRTNKRKKLKLQQGQTKFDRWLEKMKLEQRTLRFHFAIPPRSDSDALVGECQVLEVDRFMLFVEFEDGQCWWIAKGTITACGWPV